MNPALERMDRILQAGGEPWLATMESRAFISTVISLVFFVVLVEMWKFSLLVAKGQTGFTSAKFWSYFLIFPLSVIIIRMLSIDIWLAAFGNPYPVIANLALAGLDTNGPPAGTDITLLQSSMQIAAASRAGQILLPCLVIFFFCWKVGKPHFLALKTTITPKTLLAAAPYAIPLLVSAYVLISPTLWAAFFGNPEPFIAQQTIGIDTMPASYFR